MGTPIKRQTWRDKVSNEAVDVISIDGGKTWHRDPENSDHKAILAQDSGQNPNGPDGPPAKTAGPAEPPVNLDPVATERAGIEAAKKQRLKEAEANRGKRQPSSETESLGYGLLDGASFGWAGDAMGLGSKAAGYIGALSPDPTDRVEAAELRNRDVDPRSTPGSVTEMGDQYRDESDLAKKDHPGYHLAGDILGGGIATAPLAAVKPLQALTKAAPLLAGALEGGAVGGVYGAGKARSGHGLEGAAEGAGQGAVVGGVLGDLGEMIGPYVKAGARKAGEYADEWLGRSVGPTGDDIGHMMSEGATVSPKDVVGPDGTVIPAGTKVSGRNDKTALRELGQTVRRQNLDGSYSDMVDKTNQLKHTSGKKMEAAAAELEGPPVPTEGPYSYHVTPETNLPAIRKEGLQPSKGGANFPFKKNKDRIYMAPEESVDHWREKIGAVTDDAGGGPGTSLLRTRAETKQVPGANSAVRIREEAVPPQWLEYENDAGEWTRLADPPNAVSVKGLQKSLEAQGMKLANMRVPAIVKEGEGMLDDAAAVAAGEDRLSFQQALDLRRKLDKKAYDADGQKLGEVAERYRMMATEVRKAIDETLDRAPAEHANELRKAFKQYEDASTVGNIAEGSAARSSASGSGASQTAKANIARRIVGNAPERAVSGVANAGRAMLDAFPSYLPAAGAATVDEELEQAKRSLPR